MRRTTVKLILAAVFAVWATGNATSSVDLGSEYLMHVGDYYGVAYEQVTEIADMGIPHEELPVLFKIAQLAKVAPKQIAKARLEGATWSRIASAHNLDARNFYVMISGEIKGKTFLPIFMKYKMTPQSKWNEIALTDQDFVELANLKFLYSHFDYSPYNVMSMREYGKSYQQIARQIRVAIEEKRKREMAKADKE
jgi:hypothetical protein